MPASVASAAVLAACRALTCAQQKEFLRVLVASVILKRLDLGRVEVRIVWVSGHYSRREVQVPIQREADRTNYVALTERVRELFEQRLTDQACLSARLIVA